MTDPKELQAADDPPRITENVRFALPKDLGVKLAEIEALDRKLAPVLNGERLEVLGVLLYVLLAKDDDLAAVLGIMFMANAARAMKLQAMLSGPDAKRGQA